MRRRRGARQPLAEEALPGLQPALRARGVDEARHVERAHGELRLLHQRHGARVQRLVVDPQRAVQHRGHGDARGDQLLHVVQPEHGAARAGGAAAEQHALPLRRPQRELLAQRRERRLRSGHSGARSHGHYGAAQQGAEGGAPARCAAPGTATAGARPRRRCRPPTRRCCSSPPSPCGHWQTGSASRCCRRCRPSQASSASRSSSSGWRSLACACRTTGRPSTTGHCARMSARGWFGRVGRARGRGGGGGRRRAPPDTPPTQRARRSQAPAARGDGVRAG